MDKRKRIRGILVHTGLIILCLILIYVGIGAPPFTAEMAMHRQEAMHWVGPSKVIAGDAWDCVFSENFLIGETSYGYVLYDYSQINGLWVDQHLSYAQKNRTVTTFSAGRVRNWYGMSSENPNLFPVFAIPESPQAVSARMTLTAEYRGQQFDISETASLEQGVYFLFQPDVRNVDSNVLDSWYCCVSGLPVTRSGVSGSVRLELFDRKGNLLETIVTEFPATE